MQHSRQANPLVAVSALLALLGGEESIAQDVENAPATEAPATELELFQGPSSKELKHPRYPVGEVRDGSEGWVHLNFMVDPQGKAYEPVVVASSGNAMFEREAIRALEASTFNPASLKGEPVHAGANMKFTFVLRGDGGARDPFVQAYKKFNKAIGAGDKARAEDQLSRMHVTNLYEEAYKNLATYALNAKWGDETQQLGALRAAVAEEGRATYLPEKTFAAALRALLPLELNAQDFASFLRTWEKVQKNGADEALLATWRPTVEDVQKLRTDERSYRVRGRIETGTSWFYRLHKRRFQIAPRTGSLAEIKLRCDAQYVFFRFDPKMQYTTNDKYGLCTLEVVGDPGAEFDLVQL